GIFMAIELTRSTMLMHRLGSLREPDAKDANRRDAAGQNAPAADETSPLADLYEVAEEDEDEEVDEIRDSAAERSGSPPAAAMNATSDDPPATAGETDPAEATERRQFSSSADGAE